MPSRHFRAHFVPANANFVLRLPQSDHTNESLAPRTINLSRTDARLRHQTATPAVSNAGFWREIAVATGKNERSLLHVKYNPRLSTYLAMS